MKVPSGELVATVDVFFACALSGHSLLYGRAANTPCENCHRALVATSDCYMKVERCVRYTVRGCPGVYMVRFSKPLKSVVVLQWNGGVNTAIGRDRYVVDGADLYYRQGEVYELYTGKIQFRFQYMSFADRVRCHAEDYNEGPDLGL